MHEKTLSLVLVIFGLLQLALSRPVSLSTESLVLKGKATPWKNPCLLSPLSSTPVCDVSRSIDERVEALVGLLKPEEKPDLLHNDAGAVPRLNIPAYEWWNEALHGVGHSPGVEFDSVTPYATSFPQVITTASSFNRTLFRAIGQAVGREARAFHNLGHAGLTFWAPNINIFRDPRWGRGHETPGEDPLLTSDYAGNFPLGMQSGESDEYILASSCCKHFDAYSLENWNGVDRHHFDAIVTDQDLADTYYPAFQSCVQRSKASGFMCSYNAINGVPACAKHDMLNGLLRNKWGFDGYVTSDCGAVNDVLDNHHYTNTSDDTCKATLTAGMDSDCGDFLSHHLADCIRSGVCDSSVTDPALKNLFRVQMRLGMFDPDERQPYSHLGWRDVNTPEHQQLALDAARQAMVLLKNNETRLPLSPQHIGKLAIIGPSANHTSILRANYYGEAPYLITPFEGILALVPDATLTEGCADIACASEEGLASAVEAAAEADTVVLFVGLDLTQEDEGHDRTVTSFPGHQHDLITKVCDAAKEPIVLVILSGGMLDLADIKERACIGAIVWAGYPGQSGGQAVADVLFGATNPSGRLTQTFYPADFVSEVSLFDMGMRPNATSGNPGRTYRFFTGTPVYHFGFGLSYTTFSYKISVRNSLPLGVLARDIEGTVRSVIDNLNAPLPALFVSSVEVCNIGAFDGDEVVLVFVSPPALEGDRSRPIRQLVAYERVQAKSGECNAVAVSLTARSFWYAGETGLAVTPPGEWTVEFGSPAQETLRVRLH